MSLHNQIMNLPDKYEGRGTVEGKLAYVTGYQDARYAAAELATTRETELIEALKAAMRFVPKPYDMAGYGDADVPEEVEELIGVAKLLHESAMVKEVMG